MRKRGRVDANQAAIVGAFHACGAQVLSLANMGSGVPDLLIVHGGRLRLIEVKDGAKEPARRKLSPLQVEFRKFWPVHVVESVEGAVALLGGRT